MENLKRKYSVQALADAGAFVRMMEIEEELTYLQAFIDETEIRLQPVARRVPRRPVEKPQRKPKPSRTPSPQEGNGFSVKAAHANGNRVKSPTPGLSLRETAAAIVRAQQDWVRPVDVLQALESEGWQMGLRGLHAVQSALRATNLGRRKEGAGRGAAIFYSGVE